MDSMVENDFFGPQSPGGYGPGYGDRSGFSPTNHGTALGGHTDRRFQDLLYLYLPQVGQQWLAWSRSPDSLLKALATASNDSCGRVRGRYDDTANAVYDGYRLIVHLISCRRHVDAISEFLIRWLSDSLIDGDRDVGYPGLSDHKLTLRAFHAFAMISRQARSQPLAAALWAFFMNSHDDITQTNSVRELILWAYSIIISDMPDRHRRQCLQAIVQDAPDLVRELRRYRSSRAQMVAEALRSVMGSFAYDDDDRYRIRTDLYPGRGGRGNPSDVDLLLYGGRDYRDGRDDLYIPTREARRDSFRNWDDDYYPRPSSAPGMRSIDAKVVQVARSADRLKRDALNLRSELRIGY